MGISTLQSYRGAQVFEAIGLNKALVDQYFTGTASRIEGVGLDVLAREALMKHAHAFRPMTESETELERRRQLSIPRRAANIICSIRTPSASCSTPCAQERFETFEEYTRADRPAEPRSCARCAD